MSRSFSDFVEPYRSDNEEFENLEAINDIKVLKLDRANLNGQIKKIKNDIEELEKQKVILENDIENVEKNEQDEINNIANKKAAEYINQVNNENAINKYAVFDNFVSGLLRAIVILLVILFLFHVYNYAWHTDYMMRMHKKYNNMKTIYIDNNEKGIDRSNEVVDVDLSKFNSAYDVIVDAMQNTCPKRKPAYIAANGGVLDLKPSIKNSGINEDRLWSQVYLDIPAK